MALLATSHSLLCWLRVLREEAMSMAISRISCTCSKVRRELGRQLAREWPIPQVKDGEMLPVIIPIPESATHATLGFHEESLKMGTTSVLRVSGVCRLWM